MGKGKTALIFPFKGEGDVEQELVKQPQEEATHGRSVGVRVEGVVDLGNGGPFSSWAKSR